MRNPRWLIGATLLVAILALLLVRPFAFPIDERLRYAAFAARAAYVLILAAALCLYRVALGPTAADRTVAIDILGVLIVGFCAVLAAVTKQSWYLDIGIAWALQSFISALALAKYLEGRSFDA